MKFILSNFSFRKGKDSFPCAIENGFGNLDFYCRPWPRPAINGKGQKHYSRCEFTFYFFYFYMSAIILNTSQHFV